MKLKDKIQLKKDIRKRNYAAKIFNTFGRKPVTKVKHTEVKKYYQFTYRWRNGFSVDKYERYKDLIADLRRSQRFKFEDLFMAWMAKELA